MAKYFPRINILHIGDDESVRFIEYIEEVKSKEKPPYNIEYTKYNEHQNKLEIYKIDAEKYQKDNMPLIVLISKHLLELVWSTSIKQLVLEIITSKSIKRCLHIWLDVAESDVGSKSSVLVSEKHTFHRLKATELRDMPSSDFMQNLFDFLSEKRNVLDNSSDCSIDDEAVDMQKNYEDVHGPLPNNKKKQKKKKGTCVYEEALRMASMDEEELEKYIRKNKHSFPDSSRR